MTGMKRHHERQNGKQSVDFGAGADTNREIQDE